MDRPWCGSTELEPRAAADGILLHRTFTREPPVGWTGFARRIDAEMLRAVGPAPTARPRIFVRGPTAFVERADDLLVELDFATERTDMPHGCGSCGAVRAIGAHRLYRGAGLVLRCPVCSDVALVVATAPNRRVVHLAGTWRMEMSGAE